MSTGEYSFSLVFKLYPQFYHNLPTELNTRMKYINYTFIQAKLYFRDE